MKKIVFSSAMLLVFFFMAYSYAQKANTFSGKGLKEIIEKSLDQSTKQYKFLKSVTPEDRFPKTYEGREKGSVTSTAKNWTSGFYPGTLVYLYEHTKDKELLKEADNKFAFLKSQKDNKNTHDLGFMMYCSFGNAYRITKKEEYKDILVQSAKSLASRYNSKVGSIQSWDRIKSLDGSKYWDFPVIIDNMMNLELLFFASKVTGDESFKKIAVTHAETAMKNHVRPDYSSFHVVAYNPETGEINSRETYQGFAHNSTWSRGQGWGIYGFTMVYRETGDKRFLKTAQGMADFFLNHKNLPKDKIPYWDFDAGQPGVQPSFNYNAFKYSVIPRDASAGALVASALIELSGYSDKEKKQKYLNAAEIMIKSLSSPVYTASVGENGGFILKHSVGNLTKDREVDVPLSYADYYYVEAMLRYKNLGK
ncbi:glycoside hydrolase family 88 protein [Pseudopedobacter sp.]|uniref:glycoside hydrolase family 88 protein n=1 Tax=Pseudopedobacter sp. TaxID=1936787 RepID=UPI0033428473